MGGDMNPAHKFANGQAREIQAVLETSQSGPVSVSPWEQTAQSAVRYRAVP